LAIALWVLHTYIYDQYNITPRLALLSPVFGCGKTTLLVLLEQLVANPARYINVSAALVYRLLSSQGPQTLLLDEGNNQNLLLDNVLRSVMNANRRGDRLGRATGRKDEIRSYLAFAPIAIAAKGKLPNDLTQRCIVISMQRYPVNAEPLDRLNENDLNFKMGAVALQGEIRKWVNACTLAEDPLNPLKNRRADNWRPLLAIAESLGRGEEARTISVKLSAGLPDDDYGVYLLEDIRDIYDELNVDRIKSVELVSKLHTIEGGIWSEWRGTKDELQPHMLTQTELGRLLADFQIKAKTIWDRSSRKSRGPSGKGYYLRDFEAAWASYCTPRHTGTPAHR
jgi:hypothetical protein